MTDSFWADVLIGVLAALLLAWLVLVIVLATLRPRGGLLAMGDSWRIGVDTRETHDLGR